ncbi:MAG: helix-turn-helix domain-containing protein [Clostridiales bacterium]|nr:helix-turn-helix domain-containing protein [Clostridiales bacterium]
MDQQKIGTFLKELRKEKNITQDQLAEKMNVSRRTVSRWETGSNMPDLDILIDISEFYDVDLKEIFDGKRKEVPMDKETKETVLKVAEYSNDEKARIMKRLNMLFVVALIFVTVAIVVMFFVPVSDAIAGFVNGLCIGVGYGMIVIGVIITSRYARQIREFKLRLLGKTKTKE